MRVTKIIREYVEKTITAKMPYGEPTATYKQHCQSLNDLTSQLNEKINAYAEELLAGVGNLPEGFTIKKTHWSIFESSTWNSPCTLLHLPTSAKCAKTAKRLLKPFWWNWSWAQPKLIWSD